MRPSGSKAVRVVVAVFRVGVRVPVRVPVRAAVAVLATLLVALACDDAESPLPDLREAEPASAAHHGTPLAAPGANLVFISIDTTRADHLSIYGYGRPTTPNLERFTDKALVFDNAISAATNTAPSHMSMFTGLPPSMHGVRNHARRAKRNSQSDGALSNEHHTLAELLQDAGYRTAAFTAGGNVSGELGFSRGFERYEDGNGMSGNIRPIETGPALEWAESVAESGERFFLFLHTYIPHSPYVPPPEFAGRFNPDYDGPIPTQAQLLGLDHNGKSIRSIYWDFVDAESEDDLFHLRALYDEEIGYADHVVSTILGRLLALGLGPNTVFVITSDHGEQFLEHGEFSHTRKQSWEELIRVPLILILPTTQPYGRRIAQPVSSLELTPTLLDLLGLPATSQPIRESLVPRLEGRAPWNDQPALTEGVLRIADPKGENWRPESYVRSLRAERFKLIQRVNGRKVYEELYDLLNDSGEQTNQVANPDHSDELERLRREAAEITRLGVAKRRPLGGTEMTDQIHKQLKALGYLR